MDPAHVLPLLLGVAVLAPLASFFIILVCGPRLGKHGQSAASVSIIAILISAVCSFAAFGVWCQTHWPTPVAHHEEHEKHEASGEHAATAGESLTLVSAKAEGHEAKAENEGGEEHHAAAGHEAHGEHAESKEHRYYGEYYTLGTFGKLRLTIGYYIDTLTIVMFCMVTLIASCIHFYASGYMHDELHDFEDTEVPAPAKQAGHGHDHDSHGQSG